MMKYVNQDNLHESEDEMESLPLDEPSASAVVGGGGGQSPPSICPVDSIVDPPSYADAIFTSFDSASSNGRWSPKLKLSPGSESGDGVSEFLKVWVSEPLKEQDTTSRTTFYSYLITTKTNIPAYGGSDFIVRRRFRDVVALSERLSEVHRGFFLPVRPDKSVVESQMMQSEQFVEQRRAQLEKYLNKLAAHPAIRRSEELRAFLVATGRFLQFPKSVSLSPKQTSVAAAVTAEGRSGIDLLRMFKELRQSVVNDWGRVKPLVVEEDKEFLERKEWLLGFEQQLINLSQQAEALVKAQEDMGETMGELGLAFVKLIKFETEQAVCNSQRVRAADMKNVATAAVKSGRLYRELNSLTVKHLDKLHDYLGVMLAANIAFSDRSSALLTVQTLSTELTSLQSRIEKLEAASSKIFGGDRSRMHKIEELKETVRLTEDAKSCAVREYEQIKENNRSELERLDEEKHQDFMGMLRGFVLNQAGYAEKMAGVWEKLAEETSEYVGQKS